MAIALLVLLLVGGGATLATSTRARVAFWTWRMRSKDGERAGRARQQLLAIGHPAIDEVFPELLVSSLRAARNNVAIKSATPEEFGGIYQRADDGFYWLDHGAMGRLLGQPPPLLDPEHSPRADLHASRVIVLGVMVDAKPTPVFATEADVDTETLAEVRAALRGAEH